MRRVFVLMVATAMMLALAAPAGADHYPPYGPGSRAAHNAAGAGEQRGAGWERLARDRDCAAHHAPGRAQGVGPHTRAWRQGR